MHIRRTPYTSEPALRVPYPKDKQGRVPDQGVWLIAALSVFLIIFSFFPSSNLLLVFMQHAVEKFLKDRDSHSW